MNDFSPFPTADDALADLTQFLPVVWEALDSAATGAASFFAEGVPIDACLFPNLVRYYAKRFFASRHVDAKDEDTPSDFQSIGLANNGLCVVCGRYAIRIRKSDDGLVPVPGPSMTLQQFYRQIPLPFNMANKPPQVVDTSLLLLWHVDELHRLDGLELSCPRDGGDSRSSVEIYWSVPLTSPLEKPKEVAPKLIDDLEGIEPLVTPDTSFRSG